MSDSDESDNFGYLVEQSAHDESDGLNDSGESGSEQPSESNGLFDLEAADTEDDEEGSDAEETDTDEGGFGAWSEDYFFPQFTRLPVELRHRIWEFFCPDLTAKARVYWFQCQEFKDSEGPKIMILDGPFLDQQTRDARIMSAVHYESRQLALKSFPDALSFGSGGALRFNAERDIVCLGYIESSLMRFELHKVPRFRGFSEHIRHLAVEPGLLNGLEGASCDALFEDYPDLQTLYYLSVPTDHRPQHLRWCTSDLVKRYSFTTHEIEPGLGENGEHMYCWPDVDNHSDFADAKVPLEALAEDLLEVDILIDGVSFRGDTIWPLIEFSWDSDQQRFEDLLVWDGEGHLDWESSDADTDDLEPNEYESEGIDDSEFSEDYLHPDELRSDGLGGDDTDRDDDGSEGSDSALSVGGYDEPIDLTGDDPEGIAAFSSPEQSSATLRGSDTSASESDQPAPRTSRAKRPRAPVVASDSEDDSEDGLPRKRARTDNRQNPIVLSSDDDGDAGQNVPSSDDEEEEEPRRKVHRRARAVIPDEEDEEEEQSVKESASDARKGRGEWSGMSSSDDEDEEYEEEAAKPLSLAEKLQLHREENPIAISDDDDSRIEETGGDDYDAGHYGGFRDDDEDIEDDEDNDRYGLMGDDEEGEDDDGY